MEILPDRLGTWLHDETGKRAFDPGVDTKA
jgi:hypothetical protein